MRVFAALALLAFLTGCSARPADTSLTQSPAQTRGAYRAALQVPAHLGTGDQTLTFTLSDAASGVPVGDANISAAADMVSPRLPSSPVSGRAQGNGVYFLPVRLPTASDYSVQVTVRRPGHADAFFSFPITAGQ